MAKKIETKKSDSDGVTETLKNVAAGFKASAIESFKNYEKEGRAYPSSLPHRERGLDLPFTGVARSIECYDYEGNSNYRIVRLHIEDNIIMKKEYSDPYALFEVVAIMELESEKAAHSLSTHWKNLRAISK